MPLRTFEFPVDTNYARQHNELIGDRRRLQVSSLILTLALGAGAYFTYLRGTSIIIVSVLCVLAATFGVLIVWIPTALGPIDQTFRKSALVPAIVADYRENGLTLLALVNVARNPNGEVKWALVARDVQEVPGSRQIVGYKVPCVAVTGSRRLFRKTPYWDLVTPMPLAWGTTDRSVITEARKCIPGAEWDALVSLRTRLAEVRHSPNDVLLLDDGDIHL